MRKYIGCIPAALFTATMAIKVILTIAAIVASAYVGTLSGLILTLEGINGVITFITMLLLPSLLFPLIWLKKKKRTIIVWLIAAALSFIALGINYGIIRYDESITINTAPNINVHQYLPFDENSKIVKKESKTLKLTENLPRIDGGCNCSKYVCWNFVGADIVIGGD